MKVLYLIFLTWMFSYSAIASSQECVIPNGKIINAEFTQTVLSVADKAGNFYVTAMKAQFDCIFNAMDGAWKAAVRVGDCVSDPIECAENSMDAFKNGLAFIKNLKTEMKQIWQELSHMSPQDIAKIVCSSIGDLGANALLMILTGGAAAGKFGLTIAKIMLKLKNIANLARAKLALSMDVILELSEEALESMQAMIQLGRKKDLELILKRTSCEIR